MNFLDSIKRQEEEKHRISAWSRAVTEVSRFIRRHLRQAEIESPLTVRPDVIRLDGIFFVRLTVLLDDRTVTMTPISLTDSRTPFRGGCVSMRSTTGMRCEMLWNGVSPVAPDNWTITDVRESSVTDDYSAPRALSQASLDEALNRLFELSSRIDRRDGRTESARAARSTAPISFAAASSIYSGALNGGTRSLLDAKELSSFAPAYRKS
jgi:hypothetical protein